VARSATAPSPTGLRRAPRWQRIVVGGGLGWAVVALVGANLADPAPEFAAYLIGIGGSGVLTLALLAARRWWLPRLAGPHARRNATGLGIASAAGVETLFLIGQHATGADGIAADPNLGADLLITMPWYAGMVWLFVRAQDRRRWPAATVLLLGALYELGADGLIGGVTGGTWSNPLAALALLALVAFWQFLIVYSPMLLPAAWVVGTMPPREPPAGPAWRDALLPLAWLGPYALWALVLVLLAA
jgi:hypothetical protein